jgi:hypothetical protein
MAMDVHTADDHALLQHIVLDAALLQPRSIQPPKGISW